MIDVVIFFFLLGLFARLVGSDLRLPEALYETLSIYLLLAIGIKGGIELSQQPLLALVPEVAGVLVLSFLIPIVLYPVLRMLRFNWADSASIGAHFGSVSVVTFAVVTAALIRADITYEQHAPLWVAVMEAPGLIAGVMLARLGSQGQQPTDTMSGSSGGSAWGSLLHDVVFGKSVLLLLGGIVIGAVAGVDGTAPIKALFIDPFKGVLALFLLELGLVAGARLAEVKRFGWQVVVIGVVVPLLLALLGTLLGLLLDLSVGGVAIMATLAASASYIAAPTAMRIAVPQANAGLSITISLGIVFPFNVVIGIPIYIWLAQRVAG
ncbi:MAG: sodium-dependent bicarbonate transport family permease [Orrella sp.]